jgi:hypothetical protein
MKQTIDLNVLYKKIEDTILLQIEEGMKSNQIPKNELDEIKSLFQSSNNSISKFKEGFEFFNQNKERYLSKIELDKYNSELEQYSNHLLNSPPLKDIEIKNDTTMQDILKISDYILHCLYKVGYHLLNDNQFHKAAGIFFVLSTLNPLVKAHWMALAIAQEQDHQFQDAVKSYAMSSILDIYDPRPHLSSANCYIAQKDFDLAEDEINIAINCIQEKDDNPEQWSEYLNNLINEVNRQKKTKNLTI